jgi:hypothetical protein
MMIPPDTLCEFLATQFNQLAEGIAAYWIQTDSSRSKLCLGIEKALANLPILAVAVDGGEFSDPDGVMDALNRVMAGQRAWFTAERRQQIAASQRLVVVLVSYRRLGLQISSPVTLPEWFPSWPGNHLMVRIQDLSSDVDSLMSDQNVPIGAVRAGLWALEKAFRGRIRSVRMRNQTAADALWARIRREESAADSLERLLSASESAEAKISDANMFRPGAIDNHYIVSRIFRLWLKSSPDELHKVATSLAQALGLEEPECVPREFSFAALIARPASPKIGDISNSVLLCRCAVISVANAIQLSTAAAHAGDYPRFPYLLLHEYAKDIARSCDVVARALASLGE